MSKQPKPLTVDMSAHHGKTYGTVIPAPVPTAEHAISLRKNAEGDWVAATLIIEGDRVVSRDESKPNFRAYGEQQFKIRAGRMFHDLGKR
jgi:hypothetical protein